MRSFIVIYSCYCGEYDQNQYEIITADGYDIMQKLTDKVNELSKYENFELLECCEIRGRNIKFEPEEIVVRLKISKD